MNGYAEAAIHNRIAISWPKSTLVFSDTCMLNMIEENVSKK